MKNRPPPRRQIPAARHKTAVNGRFLANCYRLLTELIEPGLTNAGYYSYMTVAGSGAIAEKDQNPIMELLS